MDQLSFSDIQALGRSVGLHIQEPELTPVAHSLNALLEMMAEIDVPGINLVEPLPIIIANQEV